MSWEKEKPLKARLLQKNEVLHIPFKDTSKGKG